MSELGPRLRRALATDAPAISALVNSAYRGDSSRAGWTTEADLVGGQRTDPTLVRESIADPKNAILLLETPELVGCVRLQRRGETADLGMLTVKPTLQGGGAGRRLLALAETWAKAEWGSRRVEMTVIRARAELVAWYLRRGYRDTGRREPFPYHDEKFGIPKVPDLEFVVLEKAL